MSYKQVKFGKFKKFLGGCMLQSAQAAQQPTYLTLPWTSCKAKLIRTFADYRAYIKVEWLKCKWLCIFSFFCVLFHECHLLLSFLPVYVSMGPRISWLYYCKIRPTQVHRNRWVQRTTIQQEVNTSCNTGQNWS